MTSNDNLLLKLIYQGDYNEILAVEFAKSYDPVVFYDGFIANGATHELALAETVRLGELSNNLLEIALLKAKIKSSKNQTIKKKLVKLNAIKSAKTVVALSEMLAALVGLTNEFYAMARLFSALALHTLRKQKNINDRVVISMTEKLNLENLNNHLFNFWSLNNVTFLQRVHTRI